MEATRESLAERLWREHADALLLYATVVAGDRASAEDALQSLFARLISGAPLPAGCSERAYLLRAVRNEVRGAFRSRRRERETWKRLFDGVPATSRETAPSQDLRDRVARVLSALPEDLREAVVLKIWGGLSFPEAAEILEETEKAVEHRYYRGLALIEEQLRSPHE